MSGVFFINFKKTKKEELFDKLELLVKTPGFESILGEKSLVAVKIHFGEPGNKGFVEPAFVKKVIGRVKELKGNPFLTDTNSLYGGKRLNAVDHIISANNNGFSYSKMRVPVVIADGLYGDSARKVVINKKHFKEVYIANEIYSADSVLVITHFKGHEMSGFGGSIKNIGMGCAARRGKMAMHSMTPPEVKDKCTGCGRCVVSCPTEAMNLADRKVKIDKEKCIGCAYCLGICPTGALNINWDMEIEPFMERLVEYAFGALSNKREKAFYMNFVMKVSPKCDCYPFSDPWIVPDIGILASNDIVAIDQASVDLVNGSEGISGTALKNSLSPGRDKFNDIYPNINWGIQLDYAEKLGMGTRKYKLIEV